MVPSLVKWFGVPGENYADVKEMHSAILNQYSQYVTHVLRNIGGRYSTLKTTDQPGAVYAPVPATIQREAVAFIARNVFTAPRWLVDQNVLNKTGVSALDIIGGLQDEVLSKLINTSVFTQLQEAAALYPGTYSLQEYMNAIRTNVWRDLYQSESSDAFSRNLQLQYLDRMISLLAPAGAAPLKSTVYGPDGLATVRMQLSVLANSLQKSIPLTTSAVAKAHYTFCLKRIKDVLK